MSGKQLTCAERIGEHLEGRLSTFANLTVLSQAYGDDITPEIRALAESEDIDAEYSEYIAESALTRIYEMPLAVSTLRVHRIDLSTGGPADWLEVFVGSDGDVARIVYHFADWFDHADAALEGDDLEMARAFVDALGILECES